MNEPVALTSLECSGAQFVTSESRDILEDYKGDFTADSEIPCFYFIKQAFPALVPMLLERLQKKIKTKMKG
ncbi:hypothetical protein Tco_0675535 [Tanacetum coccineum]